MQSLFFKIKQHLVLNLCAGSAKITFRRTPIPALTTRSACRSTCEKCRSSLHVYLWNVISHHPSNSKYAIYQGCLNFQWMYTCSTHFIKYTDECMPDVTVWYPTVYFIVSSDSSCSGTECVSQSIDLHVGAREGQKFVPACLMSRIS